MIFQIHDWKFDIDLAATMEYSSSELAGHCDCSYCRNYYGAVDEIYPQLRPFLAQFGLEIEAPDELMPFDVDKEMCYLGVYSVSGRILHPGDMNLVVDGIKLEISSDIELHVNFGCPEPRFFIKIGPLVMPWVLDEPMEEAVSPANLPDFIKKMCSKLLKKQPPDRIRS